MLASGRYLYVIFMCHLALEKILKAHVTEATKAVPAKTHDLIYLVEKAQLRLPEDLQDFIGQINNASIPTRYPDDIQRITHEYSDSVAKNYLERTAEVIQWLKRHPNLQP